jgi:hypothetical protein
MRWVNHPDWLVVEKMTKIRTAAAMATRRPTRNWDQRRSAREGIGAR